MAKNKTNGSEKTVAVARKTTCPITKEEFEKNAKPIALVIEGITRAVTPREFSTGSFGWHYNEKIVVEIDGVPCKVQVNCSMIVVGSKDL